MFSISIYASSINFFLYRDSMQVYTYFLYQIHLRTHGALSVSWSFSLLRRLSPLYIFSLWYLFGVCGIYKKFLNFLFLLLITFFFEFFLIFAHWLCCFISCFTWFLISCQGILCLYFLHKKCFFLICLKFSLVSHSDFLFLLNEFIFADIYSFQNLYIFLTQYSTLLKLMLMILLLFYLWSNYIYFCPTPLLLFNSTW